MRPVFGKMGCQWVVISTGHIPYYSQKLSLEQSENFRSGFFLTAAIGGPILGAHRRAAVALGAEGGDD